MLYDRLSPDSLQLRILNELGKSLANDSPKTNKIHTFLFLHKELTNNWIWLRMDNYINGGKI
ncbi:MAG: hypothetical protein UT63_C0007G0026 [Candidatus Gottesmanbacteria bacterium GW2011_GWC2_39_8]|uniref:Uncharacterized protein n=1 Tax=Candidatus Gottesmanbacteria bacterium GW2011_GWC2_39_8 TaxID=1618450 RepID=A0A0G0Q9Q5_9BACT|nr:MAG: hypothetical protein UT63_C0007G0026 [Candidatus Gottesmanbacteria bacterium GW2011_GWC2_39_8]